MCVCVCVCVCVNVIKYLLFEPYRSFMAWAKSNADYSFLQFGIDVYLGRKKIEYCKKKGKGYRIKVIHFSFCFLFHDRPLIVCGGKNSFNFDS